VGRPRYRWIDGTDGRSSVSGVVARYRVVGDLTGTAPRRWSYRRRLARASATTRSAGSRRQRRLPADRCCCPSDRPATTAIGRRTIAGEPVRSRPASLGARNNDGREEWRRSRLAPLAVRLPIPARAWLGCRSLRSLPLAISRAPVGRPRPARAGRRPGVRRVKRGERRSTSSIGTEQIWRICEHRETRCTRLASAGSLRSPAGRSADS